VGAKTIPDILDPTCFDLINIYPSTRGKNKNYLFREEGWRGMEDCHPDKIPRKIVESLNAVLLFNSGPGVLPTPILRALGAGKFSTWKILT